MIKKLVMLFVEVMLSFCVQAAERPSVTVKFYDRGEDVDTKTYFLYEPYEYTYYDSFNHPYPVLSLNLPFGSGFLMRDEGNPMRKGYRDNGCRVKGTNRIIRNYEMVDPTVTEIERDWVPVEAEKTLYDFF